MTATRSHPLGVQPAIERLPRPTTTIGAMARIGIVCEGDDVRHQAALEHPEAGDRGAEGEAEDAADHEAENGLLRGEERRVEQEGDQQLAVRLHGIEQRRDDRGATAS